MKIRLLMDLEAPKLGKTFKAGEEIEVDDKMYVSLMKMYMVARADEVQAIEELEKQINKVKKAGKK